MTDLIIVKEHHEILEYWHSQGKKGLSILHLDFHDDLRGLLIDKEKKIAYPTGVFRKHNQRSDDGNFLTHAVIEGIVQKIRWVRGRIGGRAFDSGIVKYKEDMAALPHRLSHFLRKDREYPLDFSEIRFDSWKGCEAGEILDIDWDFFASLIMDPTGICERFEEFFSKIQVYIPPEIYLSYSPGYVHPSKDEFIKAIETLSAMYSCKPIWLDTCFISELSSIKPVIEAPSLKQSIIGYLRKKGVF